MSVSKTPPVCHQLWGGVETWNYDFRGDLVWKFQSLAKFPTVFPYQDLEVQLKHSVSDGWNPALASFQRLKLSTNGAVGIRATSGLETQSFFRKKNIKERERERPSKNWSIHLPPQQKKKCFFGGPLFRTDVTVRHCGESPVPEWISLCTSIVPVRGKFWISEVVMWWHAIYPWGRDNLFSELASWDVKFIASQGESRVLCDFYVWKKGVVLADMLSFHTNLEGGKKSCFNEFLLASRFGTVFFSPL